MDSKKSGSESAHGRKDKKQAFLSSSVKIKKHDQKLLRKKHKEENTLKKFKMQTKNELDNLHPKKTKSLNIGDPSEKSESSGSSIVNVSTSQGRKYTVSIAVSGSIVDNAQSPVLKAYLSGQIARAAAIFNVDEIIVFDDTGGHSMKACEHMARILQFLECPQYLRKTLFPLHPDLQYTGVISPLDIPHHLRKDEALPYREGVVSNRPIKEGKCQSFVYVGLEKDCQVEKKLSEGLRVTVKFKNFSSEYVLSQKGKLKGDVVSPHTPRTETGLYWGYTVRVATSLSKVFMQSPFRGGYDITIGTSEKGSSVDDLSINGSFKHVLIVFGGVEGLEYALENDQDMKENDVQSLFDYYLNTCPNQGSRTIRTEEAILISMTALSRQFGKI